MATPEEEALFEKIVQSKSAILAATVEAPVVIPSRIVTLPSGHRVEVRVPAAGDHERIRRAATVLAGTPPKPEIDVARLRANYVALCCFMPGTQDRVYGPEHVAKFLEQGFVGGWWAPLADAVQELIEAAVKAGKPAPPPPEGAGS